MWHREKVQTETPPPLWNMLLKTTLCLIKADSRCAIRGIATRDDKDDRESDVPLYIPVKHSIGLQASGTPDCENA
jgi:hypothetical protein